MVKQNKKISFEESFTRLDEIVSALEQGSESLEDSLHLFEEGLKLAESLKGKLKDAEHRIQELVSSSDEEPTLDKLN
ncbi:MAG: exodeoxyribonuclease VII small subunit [Candidatus Marinimicrobia bacterium]|jgi:exodeoxyribonuclease VII small subunit|nr:exodeoxyribonuclease VII small subunit [Candidatus Neomarinimicrobiota bacterium]MBT3618512.1 exodeoxyribonuclease VII small subunit [Candidatus Neomarinimicrobiota bacterium]MBT3828918.1 exodeoxyribonuclease VII small subunit [Candidatus Neomarinimicrobiota bacterium]MBT3997302.1 exodeoxyribonuclease VII small subunit [Candidatus Neomarinimicrobiota bacterium]MBT4281176.1 exodeoxyribonuclease VII small subunit [Candidatus Neomarinimicrobiota bacterium]